MSKILTLTLNPCIDKTIWVDKLIPEKKLKAKHPEDEPGGGGINVSRAINFLGEGSKAIFLNGGYSGSYFLKLLNAENIEYTESSIKGDTRTNLMLIDESNLLEYRIGMEGPKISALEAENLLHILKQQSNYEFLVASGSLPKGISDDFYAEVAAIVISHNAKFILDTSGIALQKAIEQKLFLLKPNLNELSLLCGISEDASIGDIIQATKQLLNKINCSVIVVSLGASGAILVTETEMQHILPPKAKVKSTVGAGDSMVAGMTIALSKKMSWKEVLQYGIACGTAATLNSGRGLCNLTDVERLYEELLNNKS
jgi:6-phosphofructokinase 2